MNPEVVRALQNSLDLAERLLAQTEQGSQEMPRCISGDVLRAYQAAMEMTAKDIRELKNRLIVLRAGQISGL